MKIVSDTSVRKVSRIFWEEHRSDSALQFVSGRIFQTRGIGEGYDAQFSSGDPFQIPNLHLALVTSGSIDMTVNLIPRHMESGMLMVITPDSIMTQSGKSEDFNMQVLQLSPEYLSEVMQGQVPPMLSHRMSDYSFALSDADKDCYRSLTDALWSLLHADTSSEDAIGACTRAIVLFLQDLILTHSIGRKTAQSHHVEIFNRFISLVNEHCTGQRDMSFYAGEIGLSKQHLSTVISSVSGRTASSWIDDALISRAKVLLRHSDLTLSQISDRLNFPAPSHFTRFFKRITSQTPGSWRKG